MENIKPEWVFRSD